jgi:hypothetical protein
MVRGLALFGPNSSSGTSEASSESPCCTVNDFVYVIACGSLLECWLFPKPLLTALLPPKPRLPPRLLPYFAYAFVSTCVPPSILGNMRTSTILIAGIHAQMIPTLISIFDQWITSAWSQVGLDEAPKFMRDCNRSAETTVTLRRSN